MVQLATLCKRPLKINYLTVESVARDARDARLSVECSQSASCLTLTLAQSLGPLLLNIHAVTTSWLKTECLNIADNNYL